MTIRKATQHDREAIAKLIAELFDYEHELDARVKASQDAADSIDKQVELIVTGEGVGFVAEDEGKLVGVVGGEILRETVYVQPAPMGYIIGLYVAEDQRGSGLGRELVKAIEQEFKAQGARAMITSILICPANGPTIRFWEGEGYRRISIDAIKPLE